MERMPEQPPKPKPPVDYTKLRPLERKSEESKEVVADKRLHALAYHMSKVPGEKRTAFQIFQNLKAKERAEKGN